MTPTELTEYSDGIRERNASVIAQIDKLDAASPDVESTDHAIDACAEALFLRAFVDYESHLERLFFHYVTGGKSLSGVTANSYLNCSNEVARRLVKGGYKFLNWAKPETIRQTASTYIENGWPIVAAMSMSQELADCERLRNRIAHNSTEAAVEFNVVQRNLLSTERLFAITPGQLLRIRHKKHRMLHLGRFVQVMNETLKAVMDPPA